MIPKSIRDYLGDAVDLVSQLAPSRNDLVDLYKAYANPLAFVNWYKRQFPGTTSYMAGAVYRVMRFFAKQDLFLSDYSPNADMDPRLAGEIPTPLDNPLLDYQYRYRIAVSVESKPLGFQQTFNFWLNTPYLLSEWDAVEMISPQLLKLINLYKLTLVEKMPNSATIENTAITEFVRYNPYIR